MIIPCALCKNSHVTGETQSASEELPFCSECRKDYFDILQYAYEQALYEYFKYHARDSRSISLESLPAITGLAEKYASSIIVKDDLYLTGMYLRYLYKDDFVEFSQKELLYHLAATAFRKH